MQWKATLSICRKPLMIVSSFLLLVSEISNAQSFVRGFNSKDETYNPRYWVEGVFDHRKLPDQQAATAVIEDVYRKGWKGVMYWGADRSGDKMTYYFKSPFLETQGWAQAGGDGLTPVVKAAHARGIKVMINVEGVNPYHWKKNQWTAANISSLADDIAATGVDAVFEECFEVKPEVFVSLARELKKKGVDYISGTDPMLLREASFAALWPETAAIDIYNYYLKRDKIFNIATLCQHGSLGYGWAKYWQKPTSMISPVNRNWGIATDYSPSVVKYISMIRALQFRLDNYIIFGGLNAYDPLHINTWISGYLDKQEKDRPVMNIVVLLRNNEKYTGGSVTAGWNRLFNSGDAITSGAFNAGYNIVVSDKPLAADAYWIYAPGGEGDDLPTEVLRLFDTGKPVFLQSGSSIPSGQHITAGWKYALEKCGVDGGLPFVYAAGSDSPLEASLPENQEEEIPYTGYYKGVYLRFTGADVQRGIDLRAGTVIPKEAIKGEIICAPNKTYGKGPYITGQNKKFLVTATCLNWEVAYPISEILSGSGILPSSNVWGIAGKNVTALLAIENTALDVTIPGLADGSRLQVVVLDKSGNKKAEQNIIYKAPYKRFLNEYDFILLNVIK
jgi:hypothetical protein